MGRKPDIARLVEAIKLRQSGMTLECVGKRLGITRQAVHQLLRSRHQKLKAVEERREVLLKYHRVISAQIEDVDQMIEIFRRDPNPSNEKDPPP